MTSPVPPLYALQTCPKNAAWDALNNAGSASAVGEFLAILRAWPKLRGRHTFALALRALQSYPRIFILFFYYFLFIFLADDGGGVLCGRGWVGGWGGGVCVGGGAAAQTCRPGPLVHTGVFPTTCCCDTLQLLSGMQPGERPSLCPTTLLL